MAMRGRVACLNTDLSAKMKQIEELLTELHSISASGEGVAVEESKFAQAPGSAAAGTSSGSISQLLGSGSAAGPFLWITDVTEGSPAATAGLLLADAILSFGDFQP